MKSTSPGVCLCSQATEQIEQIQNVKTLSIRNTKIGTKFRNDFVQI